MLDLTPYKEAIFFLERERGVKREVVDETVSLLKEYDCKFSPLSAQLTEKKLFIPSKKLKIVSGEPVIKHTEAIRYALEEEIEKFGLTKLRYRTDFDKANRLYFPYKFQTGIFKGEWLKVDIQACFYSIYSKIGIDACVLADINHEKKHITIKALGRGFITKENSLLIKLLEDEKSLRNIVYGLTRASWYILLKGKKREKKFFRGKLQNLDLTVIISSILHSIVSRFKNDILYWNIDGGIVNAEAFLEMKKFCSEFGLALRKQEESNEAIILGLGSYKIGEYSTLHFLNGVCSYEKQREYIYSVEGQEILKKAMRE